MKTAIARIKAHDKDDGQTFWFYYDDNSHSITNGSGEAIMPKHFLDKSSALCQVLDIWGDCKTFVTC